MSDIEKDAWNLAVSHILDLLNDVSTVPPPFRGDIEWSFMCGILAGHIALLLKSEEKLEKDS